MKARTALLAVVLTAAAPAFAGDSAVSELAKYTGLSERQVLMIVSNKTPYAEYRTSYGHSLAQFKRALGKERAETLIAGGTIVLERRPEVRVAALDERRNEDRMP